MQMQYDMIIVGGGPGGYTAALYAARAGLSVVVLEKLSAGGQMALSPLIENYPGFVQGIDGFTLGQQMREQAERFGAVTVLTQVRRLTLTAECKTAETGEGVFTAPTLVYAAGAAPRKLGLPGEKELTGRGVSYCASCDGAFFRGKTVAVIGGGDTAAQDAAFLSRLAAKVYLIHRRDTLRAQAVNARAALEKAEPIWNMTVTGLLGDTVLTGLMLQNRVTGESRTLACDGAFVCVGTTPATELLGGLLKLDKNGYILAGEDTEASVPGVYAVGDVRAKALRQVLTAAADGANAAFAAQAYLQQR